MWRTIALSFLTGVLGANALPHFVRGITKETYPSALGNGPVPNFVAGWAGFVLAALCASWAEVGRHPTWSFVAGALGVLLMGLFHAGPGAFGRQPRGSAAQRGSS